MNQDQWTAVDDYINNLFVPPDPALDETLADAEKAGLPPISVAPNQGKLLMILAIAQGAKNILEIGTLAAYSTIWLARALPPGGRLVTLESIPKHAEVARANVARAGLSKIVDIRLGPALETLPKLEAEQKAGKAPFDLIFIDADKTGYPDYLAWALKLSRRGTLIIADNIVRKGAVADPASTDVSVQGVRRYNDLLAADPRVSATVVQMVGSKGYDGMAVAVVIA